MQLKAISHTLKHSGFLFKHPRVLLRAFGEFIRTALLKQNRLRVVEWIINHECDSKCVMCYATKYRDKNDSPLTPKEMKEVWEECERQGAFISILEGGEPTLREDLDEIIKAMHPERNIVVIVSNCLTLTKERIRHFKKLGVSVLHLSLDGDESEKNDPTRGAKGHFEKVMQCVEWGKEAGIDIYFSSMLKHSNKDEYIKILELARKKRVGVSGALIVQQGRFEKFDDESLTEDDRQWVINHLLVKYSDVLRFDWNTNLTGKYECPAGREKVSVSIYGEVMACVCNHLAFGNIRKEPFINILKRMNEFSHFKNRNDKCIISFDTEYKQKYIDTNRDAKMLPTNIFQHPVNPAKIVDGKMVE